jgi:hypothetical protein
VVTSIQLPGGIRIDYADEKAALFFLVDPSSAGEASYDRWVASPNNPANSFVPKDVTAINTTMAMRSSAEHWNAFTTGIPPTWLQAIDPNWDIVELSAHDWNAQQCQSAIDSAVIAMNGPYRRAAGVTKMLHIKRPLLFPICDSYVMTMVGQQASNAPSTCRLISSIRDVGVANRDALRDISDKLASIGIERSLVRILDALMWFDAPVKTIGPYQAYQGWLTRHHGGRLFF